MTREELESYYEFAPWEWPEGLGDELLEVLQNEDRPDEDRTLAAGLAGDYTVINDELAEALLEILLNSELSDELRGRAAISFGVALATIEMEGGFDFPEDLPISEPLFDRIVKSLARICRSSEPKEVRRRCLEAAVRSPQGWEKDFVSAAFAGDDREWRLTAVFAMRFLNGFEAQILKALDDPDPEILAEAIRAAANWEIKGAWPKISRILSRDKLPKPVTLACIRAVGMMRPGQAERLLGRFSRSKDEDIQFAVEDAMEGGWGDLDL